MAWRDAKEDLGKQGQTESVYDARAWGRLPQDAWHPQPRAVPVFGSGDAEGAHADKQPSRGRRYQRG